MLPGTWRRTALLTAVFLFAGGPRLCAAADELGNLEGPSVPEVRAPGTATPEPPVVRNPEGASPGRVPAEPVPPVLPVILSPQNAASSNGTLPSGVLVLPFSNGSIPASDVALPGGENPVLEPLRNATFPVKPEKAEAARPTGLSPADFLPKTDAKTAPSREEPPRQKKAKPDARPEKKAPVSKPEPRKTPVKGDPLQIPQEAQKTGKVDFMEGCWVGRRPEYHTKRMITERFCFDAEGVGKRMISDPTHAGQCVGAAKATMLPGGALRILSERGRCTSGKKWGQADMTCRGEGRNTPCSWVFRDVNSGAHQAYTITFVRD